MLDYIIFAASLIAIACGVGFGYRLRGEVIDRGTKPSFELNFFSAITALCAAVVVFLSALSVGGVILFAATYLAEII